MDVKLGDCTIDVEVPLSFAQILMPFLQKGLLFYMFAFEIIQSTLESLNYNELLGRLGMDRSALTKRLEWWREKGILIEDADNKEVWTISTNSSRMKNANKQSSIRLTIEDAKDSEEEDETEASIEEQADALEQYWLYTKNLVKFFTNYFYVNSFKLLASLSQH